MFVFLILQEQHQEQMKEIRKAGHDALAVIVEEFKVKPNVSMKLFRNHVLTKKDESEGHFRSELPQLSLQWL